MSHRVLKPALDTTRHAQTVAFPCYHSRATLRGFVVIFLSLACVFVRDFTSMCHSFLLGGSHTFAFLLRSIGTLFCLHSSFFLLFCRSSLLRVFSFLFIRRNITTASATVTTPLAHSLSPTVPSLCPPPAPAAAPRPPPAPATAYGSPPSGTSTAPRRASFFCRCASNPPPSST